MRAPQFTPGTPEEIMRVIREGSSRVLRQLITDAPFVRDSISTHPQKKPDYLFGDSVRDPITISLAKERWLHKDGGGFLYLPEMPRYRSLVELRGQAVTRNMSWRLTDDYDNAHCGYITQSAVPGSSRDYIVGLYPGLLGLDSQPRNESFATARTLQNRLAELGREMPATGHRFFGWHHSLDNHWWHRLTRYVLDRWGADLQACDLYSAIRANMQGIAHSNHHFFALLELYNPDSNTFFTRRGELGLALHEMHYISGLPMGDTLYQEYFPSNRVLNHLKNNMPTLYDTLWDLTCHYHIALLTVDSTATKTKRRLSLKQFALYLFRHLESNSDNTICELSPLLPSDINDLIKEYQARSYTNNLVENGFPAETKFRTFLWHAVKPIRPTTLLAGYLAIWLKRCVVPCQSSEDLPLEVLYPAVLLAHKKKLSLLPAMVSNIHRGLRHIVKTFTHVKDQPSTRIPLTKVELPYTYLMAWLVLHRSDMMSTPTNIDQSIPLLQSLEDCSWRGRGFLEIRRQLQIHKSWAFSRCFPQFSGQYGESLIDEEKPKMGQTSLDIGCFNWLRNIRPGYLTFRVGNECFIEPYLPSRFARQFGYDQLYVGNPNQQLQAYGGLIDGVRSWLWSVSGCTGAKFNLPGSERALASTFLSCQWLLAATEPIRKRSIAELQDKREFPASTPVVPRAARSQRRRGEINQIEEEENVTFSSSGGISGGNPSTEEGRGPGARVEEKESHPSYQPPFLAGAQIIKRKKVTHKYHDNPYALDPNSIGNAAVSTGGGLGGGEPQVNSYYSDSPAFDRSHLARQMHEPCPAMPAAATIIDDLPNVGPAPVDSERSEAATANIGASEINSTTEAFSLADFDAFLMDTPLVGGLSGSTPDNYLESIFSGDTLVCTPEGTTAEVPSPTPSVNIAGDSANMVNVRPDEHAIGPTMEVGTSTVHISPANLTSHGDTGLTSQLHNLARTLMLDESPEQMLIGMEVRLFFTLVNMVIDKILHNKLPFHQFRPILDSKVGAMRNIGYSALAQTLVDDLDHLALKVQRLQELQTTSISQYVAERMETRLEMWRTTRASIDFEIQAQRAQVNQVQAIFTERSTTLNNTLSCVSSSKARIAHLEHELQMEKEKLNSLEVRMISEEEARTIISQKLELSEQQLAEVEAKFAAVQNATEESFKAELREELTKAYNDELSTLEQQISCHKFNV